MGQELQVQVNHQNTPVYADGAFIYPRANRRTEQIVADWVSHYATQGKLFIANFGVVTTPVSFGATATIDVTKPAAWMNVPSGKTVIPVYIMLYMEAFGTNAQFECNAVMGTGGSRTSGGNLVTPTNARADAPYVSNTVCYQGDNTPTFVGSTTNKVEFWRHGQQFAITKTTASATAAVSDPNRFEWKYTDSLFLPVGVGPCQIAVHQGSQAGTGFVTIAYIEDDTNKVI